MDKFRYMRAAGNINKQAICLGLDMAEPGVSLKEIDTAIENFIISQGARPSFKGYQPEGSPVAYKHAACISPNDVLVHGVPNDYIVKDGDILTVDVGTCYKGWHVDAARCKVVGKNEEARNLLDATEEVVDAQLEIIRPGCSLLDLVRVSEEVAELRGIYIMPEWGGHGIGQNIHEDPFIPAAISKKRHRAFQESLFSNKKLQEGQTICIEPVTSLEICEFKTDEDLWTVRTTNGAITAHSERCILITETGYEILT